MFNTLRAEFRSIFNDFVSCGKEYNKEREKRVNENFQKQIEVLKKYHSELEELKIFKSDLSKLVYTGLGCTIGDSNTWNDIKINGQEKCHFTRELISDDATTTKILYVVNGPISKKVFFKEGNQTKDVKEINGKLYLFE